MEDKELCEQLADLNEADEFLTLLYDTLIGGYQTALIVNRATTLADSDNEIDMNIGQFLLAILGE